MGRPRAAPGIDILDAARERIAEAATCRSTCATWRPGPGSARPRSTRTSPPRRSCSPRCTPRRSGPTPRRSGPVAEAGHDLATLLRQVIDATSSCTRPTAATSPCGRPAPGRRRGARPGCLRAGRRAAGGDRRAQPGADGQHPRGRRPRRARVVSDRRGGQLRCGPCSTAWPTTSPASGGRSIATGRDAGRLRRRAAGRGHHRAGRVDLRHDGSPRRRPSAHHRGHRAPTPTRSTCPTRRAGRWRSTPSGATRWSWSRPPSRTSGPMRSGIAARLGASQEWLDFEEGAIFDDPSHTQRIMDLLRRHKADVVITHQPTDYHPDHRALSRGVLAAALLARVDEIRSDHEPHKIGNLFYSETTSGLNSQGSIYVDVEETWEVKIEALRLHAGLSEARRGPPGVDRAPHRARDRHHAVPGPAGGAGVLRGVRPRRQLPGDLDHELLPLATSRLSRSEGLDPPRSPRPWPPRATPARPAARAWAMCAARRVSSSRTPRAQHRVGGQVAERRSPPPGQRLAPARRGLVGTGGGGVGPAHQVVELVGVDTPGQVQHVAAGVGRPGRRPPPGARAVGRDRHGDAHRHADPLRREPGSTRSRCCPSRTTSSASTGCRPGRRPTSRPRSSSRAAWCGGPRRR